MTITTTNQYHMITFEQNDIKQLIFSSTNKLLIDYNKKNSSFILSVISNNRILNTTEIIANNCYKKKTTMKRNTKGQYPFGKRCHLFMFIYLIFMTL